MKMFPEKRGEVAVLLTLVLMIVASAVFFLGEEGITGAVVGVDSENLSLPVDDFSNIDNNLNNSSNNFDNFNETDNSNFNSSSFNSSLSLNETQQNNFTLVLVPNNDLIFSDVANNSQCGTVNTNSINLVTNLSSTTTCLIINTTNASINCQGYSIIGSGIGSGILISNKNNTWIHNCNILNFSNGVLASGQFNAYINNITIENSSLSKNGDSSYNAAFSFYYITNVTIKNSTFITNFYGLLDQGSVFVDVEKNIFYNNSYAISILTPTNLTIFSNNFTNNIYGVDFSGVGLGSTINLSNNSFIINTYAIFQESNRLILAENNWWGTDNCTNISGSIRYSPDVNVSGVDFDPYLNSTGSSANCPNLYCGMSLFGSLNLTNNLNGCSGNGINILNDSVTLDCQNYNLLTTSNNNGTGIYAPSKSFTIVRNCNFFSFSRGMYISSGSNNLIQNNTFLNYSEYGVGLKTITSSQIINNSFLNGRVTSFYTSDPLLYSAALSIYSSSSNNISQNNFTNNPTGVLILSSSTNNFQSNYFRNNTVGYHIQAPVDTFLEDKLINSQTAVLLNGSGITRNNYFYNTSFENNTLDLNYALGNPGNITFINSSANVDKVSVYSGGTAYFRRYVDVNVTNASITSLNGATIEAYDSISVLRDSQNSSGITRLTLLEYYQTGNINYYVTPYTIYAKMNGYTQNSTTIDIYNQTYTKVNLSLNYFICGSNITTDFTFAQNLSCVNSGLVISADNININGNNFFLIGINGTRGIDLNGRKNVLIHDLTISNFTQGVYLEYTNNSLFYNLKIINNTIGIVFNNSNNNTIHSSVIANNSLVNVSTTSIGNTNNSLTNLSISSDSINVSGAANIFRRWFIDVNATFNGGSLLSNANLYGYFNNTGINNSGVLDDSVSTSSGFGRLSLAEWSKNSTQVTYLTPHNITLSFTFQGLNFINSTFINISQTNSTQINLSLNLSCNTPGEGINYITSSITFCPGTYSVDQIRISADNIVLTCVNTILQKKSGTGENSGLYIFGRSHIFIDSCTINNFEDDIEISSSSTNITLNNVRLTSNRHSPLVTCSSSSLVEIRNSYFGDHAAIQFSGCSSSIIKNNTFNGNEESIVLYASDNNQIYNNSISGSVGIQFVTNSPSRNNTIYFNNFSSAVSYIESVTDTNYVNYFNTSVNGYAKGNIYTNYCGKGQDLNNDGFADAVSSSGNDWPYNTTYFSTFTGLGTDFGPRMFDCPATTVHLGSTSSSSTAAVVSGSSAPPAPAAAAPTAPTAAASSSGSSAPYSPKDVQKYLKSDSIQSKQVDGVTQVTFTLENTGTQPMQLFPNILQEVDDPFFIVTRKTLGGENSKFTDIASLSYSDTPVAGRLLKATIVNPENIVLQPGEKTEKTIQIKEGLANPHQLKIQFTTLGESVLEKDVKVEKKVISGTAVDVDTQNNLMDIYAVLVPAKALAQTNGQKTNDLTGAAIGVPQGNQETYYLELSMDDNKTGTTSFSDLYGPYNLKQGQSFIFAQQIKYNPTIYTGNYVIKTKIIKAGTTLVKNDLPVELGSKIKKATSLSLPIHLTFIFFLAIVLIIALYLIYWHERKNN